MRKRVVAVCGIVALFVGLLAIPMFGQSADRNKGAPGRDSDPLPESDESAMSAPVKEVGAEQALQVVDEEALVARMPMDFEEFDENAAIELEASDNEVAALLSNGRPGGRSVLVWFDPVADQNVAVAGAPSVSRVGVRQFAAQRGAEVKYEYEILPNVINVRGVTKRDIEDLKRMPGVVRVEDDEIFHISAHQSMPLIRGLESQKTGAGLSARGAGTRVCVIDTGIRADHVMFTGRIDAAAGWNYYSNNSNTNDDNGHGTNVAGIAAGGDGFSVSFGTCGSLPFQGVAPGATIIAVKVCSAGGSCPTSAIVAGINRCASTGTPGGQADVINLSLGGGQFSGTCDADASAAAANNAVAAGVTVIAAAGNNGFANALGSPACGSQVIAVGATYDSNFPNCHDTNSSFTWCLNAQCTSTCTDNSILQDNRVCFSNRSVNLDVTAPGSVIWSASRAGASSVAGYSGTSQASPHVAGLASLIIGMDPSLTPAEVRQIIRDGAIDKGAAGFDINFGWGRIDVIDTLNLVGPGCTSNPQCDDGLACNGAETCVSGSCQPGTPVNCNDGVACTTDACNEPSGTCSHTPNNGACNDGLFCNGSETCHVTLGYQAGTPPNCADSVACTLDSCNEATDSCDHTPDNGACNDGLFCNGSETCNVTLGCQAGTPPNCADSVACTVDSCNEATDSCDHTPDNGACDDALFCNGAETCNVSLGCQAGSNPCPGQACDEGTDTCVNCITNGDCSDGQFCNGVETCVSGSCQAGTDPCAPEPCDESTDTCGGGAEVWVSFTTSTSVPGVGTVEDEDIVAYNVSSGTWSLVFDGSDVGLGGLIVDAVGVLPSGDILLSFTAAATISGISTDDSDILQFTPTSLGATTAGTFSMYFDGSDVGLTTDNEDIDAITLTSSGQLVISTLGAFSVTGISGADEDLIQFNATSLGTNTAGTWSWYFDGSDVGLSTNSNEDVDAAGITPAGTVLLSTLGAFSVTGLSGADEDVFEFFPTSLGSTTSGTFSMLLDLSALGIATGENVNAVEWVGN